MAAEVQNGRRRKTSQAVRPRHCASPLLRGKKKEINGDQDALAVSCDLGDDCSTNLVEPNGAGSTNTIGRPKLAANSAALTHKDTYTHMTTDSLGPLHQLVLAANESQREAARTYLDGLRPGVCREVATN
eukprot:1146604-Pelagomonas_calceolata.AAC.2